MPQTCNCIRNDKFFLVYGLKGGLGQRSGQGTTLQVGRTRDRFQAVTLYSVAADISVCPGVDSAFKNEYQDIPGGKGGWSVRVTTLPPSCAECLVIWSLNRPEPSGPHRPVIGVAFIQLVGKLGSGRIAPRNLNLVFRLRWLVLWLRPLYLQGKRAAVPMGQSYARSGHFATNQTTIPWFSNHYTDCAKQPP